MTKVVIKFPSPVKCDFCRYSFNNSRALDQHMESEHDSIAPMKTPVCTPCQTTFPKMEISNEHMTRIHNETDHMRITRLTQTIETVRARELMESQSKMKSKLKSLDCTECGILFRTRKEEADHMNEIHGIAIDIHIKFICSECDVNFQTKSSLGTT